MNIGYVGSNYGFSLACREIRKQRMAGRDLTWEQSKEIYRKAKMMDIRRQYHNPQPAA